DDPLAVRQQSLLKRTRGGQLRFHSAHMPPVFCAVPTQLKTSLDQSLQNLAIEWLLDEIEGAAANSANELFVLVLDAAGHDNDIHVGLKCFQPRHQLESVELRHTDVENGKIGFEFDRQRRRVP